MAIDVRVALPYRRMNLVGRPPGTSGWSIGSHGFRGVDHSVATKRPVGRRRGEGLGGVEIANAILVANNAEGDGLPNAVGDGIAVQ